MTDPYAELDDSVKEAIETPTPEPETRSKESLLAEAYANKIAAETVKGDERDRFLENEQVCLKAAEEAV